MTVSIQVQVGDKLFAKEDGRPFGAVMEVREHALLVDIEGAGPTALSAVAVRAVHDGKVIVDVAKLPPELQQSVAHAHDRETRY
jgi:hypothetical protein